MCNPMHVPKSQLVLSVLRNSNGEKKHIDQWMELVNSNMPGPLKLTKNSFVHLILGIDKLNIKKQKVDRNIYYEFVITNECM